MVNRAFVLVTLLGLGACTFPEVPLPAGERQIVVHAVLDPTSGVQTVQLSGTAGANYAPGTFDGATVAIVMPDGREVIGVQDSMYLPSRYNPVQDTIRLPIYHVRLKDIGLRIEPGQTYGLRVVTTVGDTITGTTTVPLAPPGTLQVDAVGFVRDLDTLRLGWSDIPLTRTFEVQIWAGETYSVLTRSVFSRPGTFTLAGNAASLEGSDIFRAHSVTTVVVLAVDANYYEYYRDLGDPFVGSPPGRLKGGRGVFGSVVPIIMRQFKVF
jgi:hypothetical protein